MLETAIRKSAGNRRQAIRKYRRSSSLESYFTAQYFKMTAASAASGVGGLISGTILTGVALTTFFRCAANMTYAYGDHINAPVDDDDIFGVLAIWLGTQPEDVFNQTLRGFKVAGGSAAAGRAAEFAAKKASSKALDFLLPRITSELAAKVATKVAAGAVPAASAIVQSIIVTNDYRNIRIAIRKFYQAKLTYLQSQG